MKFTIGSGMNRDPRYPGKLGIPDFIINTPQTIPQWWLVIFLLAFGMLPFGVWGAIFGGLDRAPGTDDHLPWVIAYFVLAAAFGVIAWVLRHDISQDVPQLMASLVIAAAGTALFIWLAIYRTFGDGQWFAGILVVSQILMLINVAFRSWQMALFIGMFTTQARQVTPPAGQAAAPR